MELHGRKGVEDELQVDQRLLGESRSVVGIHS